MNFNKKVSSKTGYTVIGIAVLIFLGITWIANAWADSVALRVVASI